MFEKVYNEAGIRYLISDGAVIQIIGIGGEENEVLYIKKRH